MNRIRWSDDELLADLRRVALEGGILSRPRYAAFGRFGPATVERRFGSWMTALAAAQLRSPYHFGGTWFDCPICGDRFRSNNSAKARRTCGNQACYRELKRRNAGQFKGDTASPQAARGRAATIVQRDGCNRCGHDGSEHRLEIHHRDRNPYNNEPGNLEVVCIFCHKQEHRGEPRQRRRAPA